MWTVLECAKQEPWIEYKEKVTHQVLILIFFLSESSVTLGPSSCCYDFPIMVPSNLSQSKACLKFALSDTLSQQ